MNLSGLLIVALILLPAGAVAIWIWLCMTQIEEDLDAFSALDGVPSALDPHAGSSAMGKTWPIPG